MFSSLAISYLFLGGTGAGVIALVSFIDLFFLRRQRFASRKISPVFVASIRRIIGLGFLLGLLLIALGTICLILDLGRLDRVWALFFTPTLSFVAIGAYSLTILLLVTSLLVSLWFLYQTQFSRKVVQILEGIALAAAFAVMLYTGFLLQSMTGIQFWASPFVPVLFVLSSISGGAAVIFGCVPFLEIDQSLMTFTRWLIRIDIVVILLEALAAVGLLVTATGGEWAAFSVPLLIQGDLMLVWWVGFVGCGLLGPLFTELFLVKRSLYSALFALSVLVLIGAVCLRVGIVEAGLHAELALSYPLNLLS